MDSGALRAPLAYRKTDKGADTRAIFAPSRESFLPVASAGGP